MKQYLTIHKVTGKVSMISDAKNTVDETLFDQVAFNFTKQSLQTFLEAGERFVVDGKIILKQKDEERLKRLEQSKADLEKLRNREFTKEELLDKVIEIFELAKLK